MIQYVKYLLSYFKTTWELTDYPIRIRHMKVESIGSDRQKPIPWLVQIINWWAMAGYGQTKSEAIADLKEKFALYKKSGKKLHRPGTKVPIEFALTSQIEQYEDFAVNFFEKILKMDYRQCFVSDESSLWNFFSAKTDEEYCRDIALVYKVDVSNIKSGNLVEIFKKITERKNKDSKP